MLILPRRKSTIDEYFRRILLSLLPRMLGFTVFDLGLAKAVGSVDPPQLHATSFDEIPISRWSLAFTIRLP